MNITKGYWKQFESTVTVLATLTTKRKKFVRAELAYIAGDHSEMSDAEVIETFLNENSESIRIKF